MNLKFHIALVFGCSIAAAVGLHAQATPPAPQPKPPANTQQPASAQQQPAQKPPESNPFPEDTNSVPVVPTSGEPTAPPPAAASSPESTGTTSLLKSDSDPVHSPDDAPANASDSDNGFSSSLTGANVNIPDEEKPGKHRKLEAPEKVHQETAKEDEDVGFYELSLKNWKAASSRLQSALVTDPENPEVYWGIAEAERQLKDFANARANYQKVMEYDPDSKHGKEAKKLLKDPQIANAPAVSAIQPAATQHPQQ